MPRVICTILPFLLSVACSEWQRESEGDLQLLFGTKVSQSDGYARIQIPIKESHTSLLLQLNHQPNLFSKVAGIQSTSGELIHDFEQDVALLQNKTGAAYPSEMTLLNWPIGINDPPLNGDKLQFVVEMTDANNERSAEAPLEASVILAPDSDLNSGKLSVNIVFAGEIASDDQSQEAIQQAIQIWETIYLDVGLTLEVGFSEWDNGTLGLPKEGTTGDYAAIAEQGALPSINVVWVTTIDGSAALGSAGGVPGPLLANSRSAVVLSAIAHAGPDLEYDEAEISQMGLTMAHEVGHYLGLFHPVEFSWSNWDALADTEECSDQETCEEQLGRNLMFPYALCEGVECKEDTELTEDQVSVMHRYTGVQ